MAIPMYNKIDETRLVCDKLFIHASSLMEEYPGLSANLDVRVQEVSDHVNRCVIFLKGWMLDGHKVVRKEDQTISFPSSPWQFFKQQRFPEWALQLWPVKETEHRFIVSEHHHHICPHLALDDKNNHIIFMYNGVNGAGLKQ